MAENHLERYPYDHDFDLESRLAEWSEIRRSPVPAFGQSQNHGHGHFPHISPYSNHVYPNFSRASQTHADTHIYPEYPSPVEAHHSTMTAYSPYEGHAHGHTFSNNKQSLGTTSSPSDTTTVEQTPSSAEHRVKQSTRDAVAHYEASLAAVNGVIIPAPQAPNERSSELPGNQSNVERHANHLCPLCAAAFSQKHEIGSHFVACVGRNGNPDGVCWDGSRGVTSQTTPSQQPQQSMKRRAPPRGPRYESERKRKFSERLDSVNGVVIPSKLRAGHAPAVPVSNADASTPLPFSCPICQGRFARKDHVRSHFAYCAECYGNPDGVTWDHALPPRVKRGPKPGPRPR